jgi:hypothetical protein
MSANIAQAQQSWKPTLIACGCSAGRAGIPSATVDAGEPVRIQRDVVSEGTKAIEEMMATIGMYGRSPRKSSKSARIY